MGSLVAFFGAGYQAFNSSGQIAPGALLYTYTTGPTNKQTTYADLVLETPNPNPIICNPNGRLPTQLYVPDSTFTQVVLTDASGNQIGSWDNLPSVLVSSTIGTGGGGVTVLPNYADLVTPTGTINGSNVTFTLPSAPNPPASCTGYVRQGGGGAFLPVVEGVDFTLSSNVVTMTSPPDSGSDLRFSYRY